MEGNEIWKRRKVTGTEVVEEKGDIEEREDNRDKLYRREKIAEMEVGKKWEIEDKDGELETRRRFRKD